MGVVLVADVRIREFAVEGLLRRELWLGKAVPVVHVLIGVHALAQQELSSFSVGLVLGCYREGLWQVRCHQSVKAGQQELDAVNEAQLSKGEGDILLSVVWDAVDPALHLPDGLHQQVGVIATQVVEDNGDSGGFGG